MIFTQKQLETIRTSNKKGKRFFAPFPGAQERSFLCQSDVVVVVGDRGGGKTTGFLLKTLPGIINPDYAAVVLRKEVMDSVGVGGVKDLSTTIYNQFGAYLSSLQSRFWRFESGAKVAFVNYSASLKEFEDSIVGKQYSVAIWDEFNQSTFEKFSMVNTNLRNSSGIHTQFVGSCNADPDSWVAKFLVPWIDPDTGYHKPEMNGKELFYVNPAGTVDDFIFGTTREEVYEAAKDFLDAEWDKMLVGNPDLEGFPGDLALSITVFESFMSENKKLMDSGGIRYKGRLLSATADLKNKYVRPCWLPVDTGRESLYPSELRRMFDNQCQHRDGIKYASMDVSGEGTDNAIIWIWDGMHVTNIYQTKGQKNKTLIEWTSRILKQEGVEMKNFVYDASTLGWGLSGWFDGSVPLLSNVRPTEAAYVEVNGKKTKVYENLKAELVGNMIKLITDYNGTGECGMSIEQDVLNRFIGGKTVAAHLMRERVALRWREDKDGVKQCISKVSLKKILRGSPDFIYSLMYRLAIGMGKREYKPMTNNTKRRLTRFFI